MSKEIKNQAIELSAEELDVIAGGAEVDPLLLKSRLQQQNSKFNKQLAADKANQNLLPHLFPNL
jgi:hypothetical protein